MAGHPGLFPAGEFGKISMSETDLISGICYSDSASSPRQSWRHPKQRFAPIKETIMNEDQAKKIQQLIARCWADDSFKQKLLNDPVATLTAEGVAPPAGITVKIVEDTDKNVHLVIPAKPSELSDSDLDKVAAGFSIACHGPF
jgi:hypothetical protein